MAVELPREAASKMLASTTNRERVSRTNHMSYHLGQIMLAHSRH
jgi:hypothetical protein